MLHFTYTPNLFKLDESAFQWYPILPREFSCKDREIKDISQENEILCGVQKLEAGEEEIVARKKANTTKEKTPTK